MVGNRFRKPGCLSRAGVRILHPPPGSYPRGANGRRGRLRPDLLEVRDLSRVPTHKLKQNPAGGKFEAGRLRS